MSVLKIIWGVQKYFWKEYLVFCFIFIALVDILGSNFDALEILSGIAVTASMLIIADIILLGVIFIWHFIRCISEEYRKDYCTANADKKIKKIVSPIVFLDAF